MKRILVLISIFCPLAILTGQENRVQQDFKFYVEELALQADQQPELSRILIRKQNQLDEISHLSENDPSLYRKKRRSIYIGTEASIKMILNEGQLQNWQSYKIKARKTNGERMIKLRQSKASKEDILDAQYGIVN